MKGIERELEELKIGKAKKGDGKARGGEEEEGKDCKERLRKLERFCELKRRKEKEYFDEGIEGRRGRVEGRSGEGDEDHRSGG